MLRRRDFLRLGLTSLLVGGKNVPRLFSQGLTSGNGDSGLEKTLLQEQLASDEFPFPFDEAVFECAERVDRIRRAANGLGWKANLNLVLKPGKTIDLKVLLSARLEDLKDTKSIIEFSGVKDVLDVELQIPEAKRAYYQVLYREGKDNWKALAPKSFKLPSLSLDNGDTVKVIFIADDHTFDDADYPVPPGYEVVKLSGDYVNEFLKILRQDPSWVPGKPLGALKNGYYLALALHHIMANEDPDLIILLGDTTGIGASYKWANFGLPTANLTPKDYDYISRVFWLRMRKIYSAVTPSVPVLVVLGNHDGEEQWNAAAPYATFWRRKLFSMPEISTYPEGGHPEGKYYAFSWAADRNNRGGILFIILNTTAFTGPVYPQKVEQWTLRGDQRQWLENTLKQAEKDWIFICLHHVLGGWPAGPEEGRRDIAYGRGPLFNAEDYQEYASPERVEQVWLTQMAKENGVRAILYGHDHIFYSRKIGSGLNNLELHGICAGTTKYMGEKSWWDGMLWKRHYGYYDQSPPDFWGPSGITRATIMAKEARFDYVITGWTAYSNLPSNLNKGAVLRSLYLVSPPAFLISEPSALDFRGVEGGANPEDKKLLIRNGGSGLLRFTVGSSHPWIKVSPTQGESWGKEKIISVGVNLSLLEEGQYEGVISVSSSQAKNSQLLIKVSLTIDPPPIYPVLNLIGLRKQKKVLGIPKIIVLLNWQVNPLNRKIKGYRVYLFHPKHHWVLLAEVGSAKRSYLVENISFPSPWIFGVAAVDYKEREGEKASLMVR